MIRIQRLVLFTGILLMAIKTVAYFITNSNVILTDALESLINVMAGSLALYSLLFASKPRDLDHPYGHGKIEFISASVEASLIMTAGLFMSGKAVYNLFQPQAIEAIDIGIYLTGGAGILNFALGGMLVHVGKKNNSMTMEADGKHLLSDAYSTVGMIIGLTIIYFTEIYWLDNLITILFGAIISFTGIKILRKSIPGIMDEADMKVLGRIVQVMNENRENAWIDLHNLRVIKYGSVYHLDCHMTMPWYFTVEQAHMEMDKIDALIRKHFGNKTEIFNHIDPCRESSCKICSMEQCKERLHDQEKKLEWNLENTLRNSQH